MRSQLSVQPIQTEIGSSKFLLNWNTCELRFSKHGIQFKKPFQEFCCFFLQLSLFQEGTSTRQYTKSFFVPVFLLWQILAGFLIKSTNVKAI